MKLKVSFTAILFMSCCLFLTVGCQQKKQGSVDKSVPQALPKDIHAEDVPVDIMDNLTNSAYHEYKIDEVTQIDKPSGTFYVFKLEHENNEVRLTFNSEAQLLK